jgi:heptosyltransferase II
MMSGDRILIVKLGALGDVVMSSTIVARARRERPGSRITWMCGRSVAPLVRAYDGVDEVIEVDDRALFTGGLPRRIGSLAAAWLRIAGRRFDLVVLAHRDPRYNVLIAPVRAGKVRVLADAPRESRPLVVRYFGDEYASLLGDPSDPDAAGAPLASVKVEEPPGFRVDNRRLVILVPGGARNLLRESGLRRWPVDCYRTVAEALLAAGFRVVLAGDADDEWVRPHFAEVAVDDFIGRLSIPATLGLMKKAALVITHDTGPMHFARLVGSPLVALFGPTIPDRFVVQDGKTTVLWGGANLACRPCYDGREFATCASNLCMQDISVEQVIERSLARLGISSGVSTA